MKKRRIIFLRIAWMTDYKGKTRYDIPEGAGSYVDENQDGGEVNNFRSINGKHYGFVRVQRDANIHIEKIGAESADESVEGITIVFFSKNPEGGQFVVGWYKNAMLYKSVQHLNMAGWKNKSYNSVVKTKDAQLISPEDRIFDLPLDGPGQSNIWYGEKYKNGKFVEETLTYISDPENYIARKAKRIPQGTPWQPDIEVRKKVENSAMKMVADHFKLRNYMVQYKHTENLGWDLEAVKGKSVLLLEVKGLSGNFDVIELTPNEYLNSKRNKKHYRICVVSNALNNAKKSLQIFYLENGHWINNLGDKLSKRESTSARFQII